MKSNTIDHATEFVNPDTEMTGLKILSPCTRVGGYNRRYARCPLQHANYVKVKRLKINIKKLKIDVFSYPKRIDLES